MSTGRHFTVPARHRGRSAAPAGEAERFERDTVADLRERRWLRLHVLLIAAVTTALCWCLSAGLRAGGIESLLWRPLLAVLLTWPLYLGLLALWARWLISRDELDADPGLGESFGMAHDGAELLARGLGRLGRAPDLGSGGSFSGGGADGVLEAGADALGELGGQALSGAAEAVGGADDAAVVVVPLLVVVGVGLALATALGFVVFGLFGIDILLGVAVELAFAAWGGALAWRARREGWLAHALRRTAGPMGGLLLSLAAAGWALQTWLPQARTLPQALRLLFGL